MTNEERIIAGLESQRVAMEEWKQLASHPGWKRLELILQAEARALRSRVLNDRIRSLDDAFGRADDIAQAASFETLLKQPYAQVQECMHEIALLEIALEEERARLEGEEDVRQATRDAAFGAEFAP